MKSSIAAFLLMMILMIIFLGVFYLAVNSETPEPISYTTYIVKPGDTIDKILHTKCDAYGIYRLFDIRKDLYTKSNCTALINPGDKIYIPQYGVDKK